MKIAQVYGNGRADTVLALAAVADAIREVKADKVNAGPKDARLLPALGVWLSGRDEQVDAVLAALPAAAAKLKIEVAVAQFVGVFE